MDLTFRLPGPWGAGKGSNLQPTEVDNNFWSIAEAILDLQSNPALPVGIESITVSGTQMTITLTDGTVMGPFTLPVLTFRWRGEWVPFAVYAELDVFTVLNVGIFMALLDHSSGAEFDPDITAGEPPAAALQQLFGSTDSALSGLSDVELTDPVLTGDFLVWQDDDQRWVNLPTGTLAYQNADAVAITGGSITGMAAPVDPNDVATKAYVDAMPSGITAPDATVMANIAGVVAPSIPNTLTDILDYILGTTVRGTLLFRGGPGWVALPPGTVPAQFLMTLGPGADPEWHAGTTAGITQLYPGAGISLGGGSIVDTGTISLADIADNALLANISGGTTAAAPTTLTAYLDHVLGTARGTVITRTSVGWLALAPGANGQYLKTQGSGADLTWDNPVGAGTVTAISAGTGIATSASPITSSGSVALAPIANLNLLANTGGSTAAPVPTTATLLFDRAFGTTQGSVLYRNATTWVMLTPGTTGQFLATGGAAANPSWQNAPTTGAAIPTARIISNISGSTATPSGNTLTNILDAIISSARGTLLYRGSGGWLGLAPGTSGQFLRTAGAGADPGWATVSGGGGGGITELTGDVAAGPGSGSVAATLANTAVAPGSYTHAAITVDAKGRLTAASSGTAGDVVGPGSAVSGRVATFSGTTGKLIADGGASIADLKTEALQLAVSDETTNLTTGTAKLSFRMPWAMTLTAVRSSLATASSSGLVTVDIKESGTTILSTALSIDASEKTSVTAATAAVISDAALADDAEITIDITAAGTGARGLKVTLLGTRA